MRVQATNFQSWEEADLNIEGFTTIVGPSDIGKSAIFRMIRGVFRNDISANKIKNGENELTVHVSFDKTDIIARRNIKGATTYTVDKVDYGKLAGNIPDAVATMGYSPVKIGSVELDPIFGGQFDNQFLLCSSPSDLNTVLGAFSSTEKLDQGKKKIGQKIKEIDVEARVTAGMVTDSEARLHRLNLFLDDGQPLLNQLVDKYSRNWHLSTALDSIDNFQRIHTTIVILTAYKESIERHIVDNTNLVNIKNVIDNVWVLRYAKSVSNRGGKCLEALAYLDLGPIMDLWNSLRETEILIKASNKKSFDVSAIDIESFKSSVSDLRDVSTSMTFIENIGAYGKIQIKLQNEIDTVLEEIEVLEKERHGLQRELASKTRCPNCGFIIGETDGN